MSNTTYSPEVFQQPRAASLLEIVREMFAATPLGIFVAALRSRAPQR